MESLDVASAVFYLFAAVLISSAAMVVSVKNSVHSVFFLILTFFNAAGLFVLLGAEYLAMTLVIVYVGAVAVLFLFVVMMLNINYEKLRAGFLEYLPIGLLIALVLFVEIGALLYSSLLAPSSTLEPAMPIPSPQAISNTHAIGNVLYTHYAYLFQLSGLVLLVAMIGAIVLTLRHRPGVRRQRIGKQVSRKRKDSVELVDVPTGQGA
ncbi:MAG: NADH-quinone oxidoreductase subunit J [Rickettsiales bacterium]|nr:NADH-quinone oxidoreductase subunit J [Rickettsiales bacterium]